MSYKVKPQASDKWERKSTDLSQNYNQAQATLITAVCDWNQWQDEAAEGSANERPPRVAHGARGRGRGVFNHSIKPVDFLRPKILSIETSPDKVRDWKSKFESFCKASNVNNQEIAYIEKSIYWSSSPEGGWTKLKGVKAGKVGK